MPEHTAINPAKHLNYLDAARGIAALMVMAYHYINWIYEARPAAKLASIIFNGSDAVSFFFVLSGFVLSYKYVVLGHTLDIKRFYVSRLFRLWPAYFVAVLLCTVNANIGDLSLHNMVSIFARNTSHFWEEAFLPRGNANLYAPGWTLVIELSLSFFIPFTIVLAKKNVQLLYWVLAAYLLIGNAMRDMYMFNIHFTLGVLISSLFVKITDSSFRQTKWYRFRYGILFLSFLLFSIRPITRLIPVNAAYTYIAGYLGITYFHYTGIASFVFIIAIIISKKAQRILTNKVLLFFGRISYGIYLMHWMLVVDVFRFRNNITPHFHSARSAFICMFLLYAAATILLATVLHYVVELPFIKMGKRIAGRLKKSYIIS